MCEMLGNEPNPDEVPVEFEDLPLDVQEAYVIYSTMQDTFDPMHGAYLGKSFSGLLDVLALYDIEDRKLTFNIIKEIDKCRIKISNAKQKNKKAA